MRLDIRGRKLGLGGPLRTYVQRRLQLALDRFDPRIRQVAVLVSDVNGRQRGADKRCLVTLTLKSGRTVMAEYASEDFYGAIDQVATKLKLAVRRELTRRRTLARAPRAVAFATA